MILTYPSLAGCEIPTPIYNPIKNQASFGDDIMRMVQDTTYNTEEEGMQQFFGRLALYHTLKQVDSLREEEILANFEDMEQYQTIGKFYNAEQEIALAFDSSLYVYDSVNYEYADSLNNLIKMEHLNNAKNYLADINTNLQSVQYYQTINQLYLNYLLNDSLDVNEIQSVASIANLCPYMYGTAIPIARTIASAIDSTLSWDDNSICYGNFRTTNNNTDDDYLAGLLAANAEKKNKKEEVYLFNNKITVYPNPTDRTLHFTYNDLNIGDKIIIYNYLGIEVLSKFLYNTKGDLDIDVNQFKNGLYIYHVASPKGDIIANGKFNVIHSK
ncbi:MAG: Secretion system C-terminal sorting domain [Bacteroidota bacterium]|jgi:hypothetical protein